MTVLFFKLLTDVPIEEDMRPWKYLMLRFGKLHNILALDSMHVVHVDDIAQSVCIDVWAALQICLHRLKPILAKDAMIDWTMLKVIEWLSSRTASTRHKHGRSSMLSAMAASLGDVYMYADNIHATAMMYRDTDPLEKTFLLVKCVSILLLSCKCTPISNEYVRRIVETPLFLSCLRSDTHSGGARMIEALLQTSLFAGIVVGAHLIYRGVAVPRHIAVYVDRLIVQSVLHTGIISRSMYERGGLGPCVDEIDMYDDVSQRVQKAFGLCDPLLRRQTMEVSCILCI